MSIRKALLPSLLLLGAVDPSEAATCPVGKVCLEIQSPTPRPQDANFRLAGTYGFSVVWEHPSTYRLYATSPNQRKTWLDGAVHDLTDQVVKNLLAGVSPCPLLKDPESPTWDLRCQEQIGLYWKKVDCARGAPCESTDRWNAYPGLQNVTAFPAEAVWPRSFYFDTDDAMDPPNLQHENDFGIPGYQPVLTRKAVNAPPPCAVNTFPPPTESAETCHPENPNSFAKGVANGKVVQVYYGGGKRRWFMAYNATIKTNNSSGSDRFRIAWAYSNDGKSWSTYPNFLLRSRGEASTNCRSEGFLVTDMFLDQGKFYIVFFEIWTGKVYLARSPIAAFGTVPGYGAWQISGPPAANGKRTWLNFPAGCEQIDLQCLGSPGCPAAASIFPSPQPTQVLKQTDINRVYVPGRSGAGLVGGCDYVYLMVTAGASGELQVWTAPSLEDPFTYQSEIDVSTPQIRMGLFSWEFGLTQYPDNLDTSPRLKGDQLDFWIVQNLSGPGQQNAEITVTRTTARLKGGIFDSVPPGCPAR